MALPLDVAGQTFGALTAINCAGIKTFPSGQTRRQWRFRCECGAEVVKVLFDVMQRDTKSCGCKRKGRPAPTRLAFGESAIRALFGRYKKGARERQIGWALSNAEFRALIVCDCHYCGCAPAQIHKAASNSYGHTIYNGIDRLSSSEPYIAGNVVACCGRCNEAKNDTEYQEFLAWVRGVYAHRAGQNSGIEKS